MKVVKLIAENIKRIQAVEITPTGDVIEVAGANGNGKSSILDALWWCLAGTSAVQAEPIRKGQEKAHITLDLGKFKVTRKFRRSEGSQYTTSLTVENGDGMVAKKPQELLNDLLSGLTFDPLAFARMKPREQFDALKSLVPGVDFDGLEAQRKQAFDARTEANKRLKDARSAADGITVPDELPARQDEDALLTAIANAGEHNAAVERERSARETRAFNLRQSRTTIESLRKNVADLRREADELEARATELTDAADIEAAALDELAPLPERTDTAEARQRLIRAQEANRRLDQAEADRLRKSRYEEAARDAALASDELTAEINGFDKQKADAIAAAQMPVDGLGFGDGFITLNGVPFEQGSDAEQLRASIAIAMCMNPKLKVVRVRDGSLLDDNSFQLLCQMAAERDVQVWVESVKPHVESALIIEDGTIRASQEAAA